MTKNELIHTHVGDYSRRIETREVQIRVPVIVCHTQYVFVRTLWDELENNIGRSNGVRETTPVLFLLQCVQCG